MKAVYKYRVHPYEEFTLLPDGAKILSVGEQDESIYIWALVNPAILAQTPRRIRAYGTGHPIEDGERVFIGTVQMRNGLVFHFFEEI
jgi:hypothetical protein